MPAELHLSRHAALRMQTRCVAPLVVEWLRRFFVEQPASGEACLVYFDRSSSRCLSRGHSSSSHSLSASSSRKTNQ